MYNEGVHTKQRGANRFFFMGRIDGSGYMKYILKINERLCEFKAQRVRTDALETSALTTGWVRWWYLCLKLTIITRLRDSQMSLRYVCKCSSSISMCFRDCSRERNKVKILELQLVPLTHTHRGFNQIFFQVKYWSSLQSWSIAHISPNVWHHCIRVKNGFTFMKNLGCSQVNGMENNSMWIKKFRLPQLKSLR